MVINVDNFAESGEKTCPICNKVVRSDALVRIYCALCGMGIAELDRTVQYETLQGVKLNFCCDKCQEIYLKNLI